MLQARCGSAASPSCGGAGTPCPPILAWLAFRRGLTQTLHAMSITTKTGDDGTTQLMFARRVPKTALREAACGVCDELNAALGVVRAFCDDAFVREPILVIQKELVTLMGELGVFAEDR